MHQVPHPLCNDGVLCGGSLEDGARPPVGVGEEQVHILRERYDGEERGEHFCQYLASADQAVVVIIRVHDDVVGGADNVCQQRM